MDGSWRRDVRHWWACARCVAQDAVVALLTPAQVAATLVPALVHGGFLVPRSRRVRFCGDAPPPRHAAEQAAQPAEQQPPRAAE